MNDGRELWERLRAAGVVQGEMPSEERPAPWYVRAVQGLSGWLAAVCLLIFLGTLFHDLFRQSGSLLALGGLLTALAAALLHRPSGSDFRAQFGLVFSLAGQVMLLGGFKDYWDTSVFWLLWAGLQVVLVLRIPLPVHRFISAMAVIYALTFASAHTPLLWLVSGCLSAALAWVMLTENHRMAKAAIWSPVTAAIAIALLQTYGLALLGPTLLAEMLRHQEVQPPTVFLRNLNEALVALVWMGTAGWLLHQRAAMMSARMRGLAWAGIVAVALWSTQAQGLTVAWLMLVLGFARSNPVLAGLGTTVFWGFLFRYYYLMQTPLLTKSAILGGGGLVFLLAYAVLHWLGREDERHA
ncbi:uncharacterized protein DUF4401 [Fluviicoccus keumensis]|uniref:Uncharacterized protein DUF4401 n=1 Tax=Fluviicoccus keumensis TaxID=1435465 RepID=A0A4Q7ZC27_9GAMM|nr:DUF4401 domain-containing protein [Fluviicoccus keumensis]RZU48192.1 uncharacterized protein DUF4401 [Fluviicoccus keumensis]